MPNQNQTTPPPENQDWPTSFMGEEKPEDIELSSPWEDEKNPEQPSIEPNFEEPTFEANSDQQSSFNQAPLGSEETERNSLNNSQIDSPFGQPSSSFSSHFSQTNFGETQVPPEKTMDTFTTQGSSKSGIKKFFLIFFILVFLALGIFAVFKYVLPKFKKTQEVTLRYWGLWESPNVMQTVINDWQKEHPHIKIEYVQQSPKEYRERLQSALARKEGPDVFRFHITWVPMLKNELEAVPPEVMSATDFEKNFYPVAKENLRSGSSFLGLPLHIDTLALFYNRQIFQAAGKTPPTSWDQLRQTALDLTIRDESGRIQTAGVALGTTVNVEHWSDILGLMMLQNGVDLSRPSSNLAEDALTYFTIFNNIDRVWDETLPSSTVAFATGKVAMFFGYSWDVFEIKNLNPNLDFGIVPVPQLAGEEVNWASFWVEGVAKKSEHKKEAWEFMKFLSSPQTLQKLYQSQAQTRLFGELYPQVGMANLLTTNSLIAPFINQAPKAKTWYLCSRTFDNGLNDRMIKYFEDAVNSVNAGKDTKEALSITEQGVSQLLSQYGLGSYTVR